MFNVDAVSSGMRMRGLTMMDSFNVSETRGKVLDQKSGAQGCL